MYQRHCFEQILLYRFYTVEIISNSDKIRKGFIELKKIAQFYKVGFDEFKSGILGEFPLMTEDEIKEMYENLKLPQRATRGSAGYDFYSPVTIELKPGETVKIPTGIRARMEDDWVLMLFPRSGLGFKYRLQLNNTVGIIDSDYYYSDNEGHIFVKITNDSNEGKELTIEKGNGFIQGIFMNYGLTVDDNTESLRNGGFGSTTGK